MNLNNPVNSLSLNATSNLDKLMEANHQSSAGNAASSMQAFNRLNSNLFSSANQSLFGIDKSYIAGLG